jgi:RHS repeat-associated protein
LRSWVVAGDGGSVKVITQPEVNTRFTYLGLADQIAVEEQTNPAGTYEVSKVYTYGPGGEKLALIDTPVNGTTTKKSYYGLNPHGDVESLTDATTGQTSSTYRYTAYGTPDTKGTTGADAITGDPVKDADVVNPYRFNAKRFDGATGTYDMGFREYDPGLNRFLSSPAPGGPRLPALGRSVLRRLLVDLTHRGCAGVGRGQADAHRGRDPRDRRAVAPRCQLRDLLRLAPGHATRQHLGVFGHGLGLAETPGLRVHSPCASPGPAKLVRRRRSVSP